MSNLAALRFYYKISVNHTNHIVYYENNKRVVKTYAELSVDIDTCIKKLHALDIPNKIIGISGPTSYSWMVLDLACIKGGYHSLAIPETFNNADLAYVISKKQPDIYILDDSLRGKWTGLEKVLFFNSKDTGGIDSFEAVLPQEVDTSSVNALINYGTAFSSGTSGNIKHISLNFPKTQYKKTSFFQRLRNLKAFIRHSRSFWIRKDNKVIIFMPFSHTQQRHFVLTALRRNINIVLSSPADCIKHIIVEKPNIMVSVPVFYEILAKRIEEKISRMSPFKKFLLRQYNNTGINGFSNSNAVKKLFDKYLLHDIKKIYGGKADYFITGSAPIQASVLQTFYKIGVKIFEAYGQSETDIIAINTEKAFKIGSVGKPAVKIKISDDSEVLIKYNEDKFRFNKDILNVRDGYIHTGDIGYLDKDGFLFLQGRMDDVIVLGNGKKVFPHMLEFKFVQHEAIEQAFIFGNAQHKLCIVLYLKNKTLADADVSFIIKAINEDAPPHEQIHYYLTIPEPLSIKNELLTGSFKIKRNKAKQHFLSYDFKSVR